MNPKKTCSLLKDLPLQGCRPSEGFGCKNTADDTGKGELGQKLKPALKEWFKETDLAQTETSSKIKYEYLMNTYVVLSTHSKHPQV